MTSIRVLCWIILFLESTTLSNILALKQHEQSVHFPRGGPKTTSYPLQYPPVQQSTISSIQVTEQKRKRQLDGIRVMSTVNILINTFRPSNMTWQMRLPRICWEVCIRMVASSSYDEPSNLFLLSLMLGSTALIDIFLWGPIFGAFTSFETCKGGGWFSSKPRTCQRNYTKGLSGLLVTFQSIFGGLFYLTTAVALWNYYWSLRVDYKVERQMAAMAEVLDNHERRRRVSPGHGNQREYPRQ